MPRVLVVDDERRVGEALQFALGRHGFTISQEMTGDAAAGRARREAPDCILLDVSLGSEDGVERCRLLKADPVTAAIPVILLSGKADPESIARGLDAGADDYITKPFTPAELRARVERHLRRREG